MLSTSDIKFGRLYAQCRNINVVTILKQSLWFCPNCGFLKHFFKPLVFWEMVEKHDQKRPGLFKKVRFNALKCYVFAVNQTVSYNRWIQQKKTQKQSTESKNTKTNNWSPHGKTPKCLGHCCGRNKTKHLQVVSSSTNLKMGLPLSKSKKLWWFIADCIENFAFDAQVMRILFVVFVRLCRIQLT